MRSRNAIAQRPGGAAPARGFSLVEISVILVIVGLILATLLPAVLRGVARDVMKSQKRQARAAREEVVGYIVEKSSLPQDQAAFDALSNTGGMAYKPAAELAGGQDIDSVDATTLTVVIQADTAITIDDVAFVVAHPGVDRQFDQDYTANTITIGHLHDSGFDDIVDYSVLSRLKGL